MQFVDSSATGMIAGFITGGPQALVVLNDLRTKVNVIGSNVIRDRIVLEVSSPEDIGRLDVELVDVSGRVVRVFQRGEVKAKTYMKEYSVEGLANGVYFLRVKAGKATSVRRVIILRQDRKR